MKAFALLGTALVSAVLTHALSPAGDKERPKPRATDAPKPPPKPTLPKGTPAEQVRALITQHASAMAVFRKLMEAAKTDEELEKLEPLFPDPRPYATLLVQIAEKTPKDAAAVDALIWAVRQGRSDKAKEILLRDHLLHTKIGPLCLELRHGLGDAGAVKTLRRVLTDNPAKEAQAHAAVALALLLRSNASQARQLQKAEGKAWAGWEKTLGKEVAAFLKAADAAALEKEAEELLERVSKDRTFAETKIPYDEGWIKLGDLAGRELFEMSHLQPGKAAPEIVGEDIEGKAMKLSDFRGKVVLLDFWGHW
jgi:hypothetical protein